MNEFQRLKKESYPAHMSHYEQAMRDKDKVKRNRNSLKRKYKGVISCLKLELYASTKEKLLNNAEQILKKEKLTQSEFKYIGLL